MTNTINWDKGDDGIVTLTIDDPNQRVNTMNADFQSSLQATVQRLEDEKDDITGVILTSGKETFFAGGDLRLMYAAGPDDAQQVYEEVAALGRAMRRMETLGKPVVAALNGTALGGGLELALACHHRIAVKGSKAKFGQPEVKLGLLPGGGGVVRITRMLGVVSAIMNVLAQGQEYRAEKAHELGLISELVDSTDDLIPAAKAFIAANPESSQPFDDPKYKVPGGVPTNPKLAQMLPGIPSNLRKQLKGAPMPAPLNILAAAVESLSVPIDRAWEIEHRYFVDLVVGQVSRNMTKAFFFDLQAINSGSLRPEGVPPWKATKVAVLGAGMMGAGIAYQCASVGIDVVLKDISVENAEKGKNYSVKLVEKARSRGKLTEAKAQALLDRITPTDSYDDLEGCDLIIEAVFEKTELKHAVFGEAEPKVLPDAVLGSNTSTIPITILAEGVTRPEDFIGLHFFSPVDKMPLVEIIAGEKTNEATIAKAIDLVQQIRKTPIVVNDSRGFFTSRVIGTFTGEAMMMLDEGVNLTRIDRAATMAGYPVGPLQMVDELTLTLPLKIIDEYENAARAAGEEVVSTPDVEVLRKMVAAGREGRSAGAGFFEYGEDGKRTQVWPGLVELFPPAAEQLDVTEIQERMLFREAIETVKCFDEGVLRSVPEANIGSIFGIGFPAWTGGVIQYIDGYEGGVTGFVARCKELADTYGERFTPPASLVAKAESGEPLSPAPF